VVRHKYIRLSCHGSDLDISLEFKLNKNIPQASVQIVIWNQDLLPVMDVLDNSLKGCLVENNKSGRHVLELSVPKIGLNSGKYAMSVIINAPDMSITYCRYDNAGVFTVATNFASGAHILQPTNWNQVNNN
jgi:hypothetical protein